MSDTSANPTGPRFAVPLKMTSSIFAPRRDIRFAGAVRTDDRGHAAEKFDLRAVGKRLEPL